MKALGRFGLGGLVLALAACGATTVHRVGDVGDGGSSGSENGGSTLGNEVGGAGATALGGSSYGGSQSGSGGTAGAGGYDAVGEPTCPECKKLVEANDVRGFAATADYVYWIEHGTLNDLDELNDDGRVVRVALGSHKRSSLVADLPGPVALGISRLYTYVFLENHGSPVLRRYPFDGGEPENVAYYPKSQLFPREQAQFASTDNYSYYQVGNELHRVAELKGRPDELVATFTEPVLGIAADETYGYFRTHGELYGVDAPGATPQLIAQLPVEQGISPGTGMPYDDQLLLWLRLSGDHFYGVEINPDTNYVTSLPKGGGSWKRLARIDSFGEAQPLDDGFFGKVLVPGKREAFFIHAAFADPANQSTLATFPNASPQPSPVQPFQPPWVPTAEGVYWATQTNVYFALTP